MWVNYGAQQFHLPFSANPQIIDGVVGLVFPCLKTLEKNLQKIEQRLSGTNFQFKPINYEPIGAKLTLLDKIFDKYSKNSPKCIEVTCPWGNRFRVHEHDASEEPILKAKIGISYIQIYCPLNSSGKIAHFYQKRYQTPSRWCQSMFSVVCVGMNQYLYFEEKEPLELQPYSGWHLCIYIPLYIYTFPNPLFGTHERK
jgi:hypothetical protein